MSTTVGAVDVLANLNTGAFNNQIKNTVNGASNAFSTGFGKIGGIIAGAFAIGKIIDFGKTTVSVASQSQNAFIGLNSILTGQGKSFSAAKSFLNDYIDDGLVPLQNAVTSYKNLASRGYNDTQVMDTMTKLKDAASFGRQASYSLGDAVQTATEGLKNENSILVDNAGVTKNVSVMWADYAKSIGVGAMSLTKQQKIQAEVNGIMEETKFQTGDAIKYSQTFSGSVARVGATFTQLKTSIGNVIIPIAQLFIPVVQSATSGMVTFFNTVGSVMGAFGLKVSTPVSSASTDMSSLATNATDAGNAVAKAGKQASKATAPFDEISNIQLDKDSSSDSGSSTAGGISTPVVDATVTDSISPKVQEMVNKINTFFKPITNSFNRLKESSQPFIDNVGGGLKWVWDNVLVPLGRWTISTAIPTFLDTLSSTFTILNPLLDGFKVVGGWLWTNFLQPIAVWTGGVIVSVLTEVGNKLSDFGTWMNENPSKVQDFIIVIGSFAAAWGLVNLVVGIWSFVAGVATGATTAFGAAVAFLTSPFGIAVIIIGGLIAAGLLLAKNWDTVKAIAGSLGNSLGIIFGNVGVIIGVIFKGIVNTISTAINAVTRILNVFMAGILLPFNAIIWGLNQIPGVSIPTLSLNIPRIPMLAQGGFVPANSPQLAIVGDNKREGEIISPESKMKQSFKDALLEMGGSGGQSGPITLILQTILNGKTIAKEILDDLDAELIRKGYKGLYQRG